MRLNFLKTGNTAATLVVVLLVGFAPSEAQHAQDAGTIQIPPTPVRKICDPHTGLQWVLEHDPLNQGGPGRMVVENDASCGHAIVAAKLNIGSMDTSGRRQPATKLSAPLVIRSGDRLVIEESTPQLETRLEAVALSSAAAGAELTARLAFQGSIVRAVALKPGRAALTRALGSQRRP